MSSSMKQDRIGNPTPPEVPYARGSILSSTEDDITKLRAAWRLVRERIDAVHFAGLPPGTAALMIKFLPPETLARFGGPAIPTD